MRLNYDQTTDSLYIDLSSRVSADSQEIADSLVVDYDELGHVVGIDIQHASERIDLTTVESSALPIRLHSA